jgi:RND family efflux transporter MFP subunit
LSLLALLPFLLACEPAETPPPPSAGVPVRSEVVEPAPFRPSLTLLGRVEPASRVEVRAAEAGRIRYAPRFAGGLRTGEGVRRGELLFTVDSEEARLRLAEAELGAEAAEAELERARRGVDEGFLPAAELERREIEAELARERLRSARERAGRLEHRAAVGGVLRVERSIAPGAEVRVEEVVAAIAGDGAPRVEAWAAGGDLERLAPGLAAVCRRPVDGREAGRGHLAEVAAEVGEAGTARLVVAVDEPAAMPPPGSGLEVEVLLAERRRALTVPVAALRVDGGATTAFVLEPSGAGYRARRRLLLTGGRSDGRVEVLDGVAAGDRVAVTGAELLADGVAAVEAADGAGGADAGGADGGDD